MTEQQERIYRDFEYTNENYLILCTISTYTRTKNGTGQGWKANPDEIERNVFKAIISFW